MSYSINVSYMEIEELAYVEVTKLSEHYETSMKSQFQSIGWLLRIQEKVDTVTSIEYLQNPNYLKDALFRLTFLSEEQANNLVQIDNWFDRLDYVWSLLEQSERELALSMNSDHYDNLWPGFDLYILGMQAEAHRRKTSPP